MEYIYPWNENEFSGNPKILVQIKNHLESIGVSSEEAAIKPPKKTLLAVNYIVSRLIDGKWVTVISDNYTAMKNLRLYVPYTFMLSENPSLPPVAEITSNIEIADAIAQNNFKNGLSASEMAFVDKIKKAGLLVWDDLTMPLHGFSSLEARFSYILRYRHDKRIPTLFFAPGQKKSVAEVFLKVGKILGHSCSTIISDMSEIVNIAKESKPCVQVTDMEV